MLFLGFAKIQWTACAVPCAGEFGGELFQDYYGEPFE
jgi:hypothetical protein